MKLSAIAVVLFFAASTVAAAANKKYIVTFPKDTPQGDVEKACQELISQGATITHKYRELLTSSKAFFCGC